MQSSHSHLNADVLVVGAGPAGLACAIRLARKSKDERRIVVLEKSAHAGGHLLSGAVMRTDALRRLLTPSEFAFLHLGPIVARDSFHALTPRASFRLPFVPPKMRMKGLPIASASTLGHALAQIAGDLGVDILTGQTADALVWEGDRVAGVATHDETVLAPVTVLAEGPAGLLTRELYARHPELRGKNLQTHGLGLKEVVEIPPNPAAVGTVLHTFGYPLGSGIYGGGFLYHVDAAHVALGLALALDYREPGVHPHELFRRWKRHPLVQRHVAGGRAVEYGARLVPEGGWHSLPNMSAPGAFVVGDSAGLVDVMELKGLHLAVESGMAAADAILRGGPIQPEEIPSLAGLRRTPSYRAAFRAGLPIGMAAAGLAWLTRGLLPAGRLAQRDERTCLDPIGPTAPAAAAADQGPLDLGIDSDLYLVHLRTRVASEHIEIRDPEKCRECFRLYAAPCVRFCPANVYAAGTDEPISIRAENCVQCRCCTLKCPFDNIDWQTPRHGVGPDYRLS